MAKNYYEILGVSKTATKDEIKSAYRKLVKEYHPDLHPNDENAAAKFKEINEANETLSDDQKRAAYDYELEHPGMGGAGGFGGGFSGQGFGGFGNFGDIFSDFFSGFGGSSKNGGGKEKGEDIQVEIELSFLDAAKGCNKKITYARREPCSHCKGTGAKDGTAYVVCPTCGGSGKIQVTSGSGFFRSVSVRACSDCGGTGKKIKEKCSYCSGKGYTYVKGNTTLSFDIPAGADSNSYIRKKGYGHASLNGGEPGDLIVTFKVLSHKIFTRQRFDLYVDLPVPFMTLALGGKVKVPTLDSVAEIEIPAGTQSGKKFVVRGKGIKTSRETGSLYVTVSAEVPSSLSRAQKQQLADFAKTCEIKQTPKSKEYNDNMESLYGVKPYEN